KTGFTGPHALRLPRVESAPPGAVMEATSTAIMDAERGAGVGGARPGHRMHTCVRVRAGDDAFTDPRQCSRRVAAAATALARGASPAVRPRGTPPAAAGGRRRGRFVGRRGAQGAGRAGGPQARTRSIHSCAAAVRPERTE